MKRMKKIWQRVLCFALALLLLPTAAPASGEDPFSLPQTLPELPFRDVLPGVWFYESIQVVCALDLMQGITEDTFSPGGTVLLAQGIASAVRLYEKYRGIEAEEATPDGPWYTYYVQKAEQYGLLPEKLKEEQMLRPITKVELCAVLYRALPKDAYNFINEFTCFLDYAVWEPYWKEARAMYRSGIISSDKDYCIRPFREVRRSELALILTRLARPEYRVSQTDALPHVHTGMNAFRLPGVLPVLPFADVEYGNWFYAPVRYTYALGLMQGVSDTSFNPKGTVTLGQAAAVAVRVYESYYGLDDRSAEYSGKWYDYYMYMAQYYGILPSGLVGADPQRAAVRAEVAAILHGTLPEYPALRKVESLPDYDKDDLYWEQVKDLYEAGILNGVDEYGTFKPENNIRRSELASILSSLALPVLRKSAPLVMPTLIEKIVYGRSGGGRELVAYRYGSGPNVLVLTFALHGFEDCYAKDGQLLVDTANTVRRRLEAEYDLLVRSRNWSVYVIPCANPDGLAEGWTNNGPGRCTVYSYDSAGNLQKKGYDLNRSFPYNWSRCQGSRNYNGTAPLQAPEAKALADFTQKVKGSGYNVLIDSHGWLELTMAKGSRNSTLARLFEEYFSENSCTYFISASGFYAAWAGHVVGYDSCMFEFPEISGYNSFYNRGYHTRFANTIALLLRTYTGPV